MATVTEEGGAVQNARNGLSVVSGYSELGGTLIKNTTITQAGYKITYSGGASSWEGTTGDTPASGAGTRMMWIPSKIAFRAGEVTGTQWDAANIGSYSFAAGLDNTASGIGSFASGVSSNATQRLSVAIGDQCNSSADTSFALGYICTASGERSFAIGGEAAIASGIESFAIGKGITASGTSSFIIGNAAGGVPNNNVIHSLWVVFNNISTKSTPDLVVKDGGVGIGNVTAPTARLHLQAGTATANTGPLKFTSGINLTSAEAGAMEYDGTRLYFTPSVTRQTLAFTDSETFTGTTNFSSIVVASGSTLTVASDTDATTILGRAKIGSTTTDEMWIAHFDNLTATNYCIRHTAAGATLLNGVGTISLRIGGNEIISFANALFTIADARNFAFSTGTGTKLGTATGQKIGFWNATPAIQPTAVADAAGGATIDAEARTAINSLLSRMRTIGIIAT